MDTQLLVTAMAKMSRTATEDFSAEGMLTALCEVAAEVLNMDGVGVMIRTADGYNKFVHASHEGVVPVERLQEALQMGPCADSMLSREPMIVGDLSSAADWPEFRVLAASVGIGAVMAVPLLSRGRVWGVLDLYRHQAGSWHGDEQNAAQVLADVAVSYLVMAHDRDEAKTAQLTLAHLATHDKLTGLPNRALLYDRLEHALAAVGRKRAGVAVIFLDLDLFKGINDTFGHTAGDAILVDVAARLSATLREGDTLARFAGDEFVVVCEGLPQETPNLLSRRVQAVTDRLQQALVAPFRVGDRDMVMSASMGVAVTTDTMSAQDLITDADTAMYAAKQAGRGRVHLRDHTVPGAVGYAGQLERQLGQALGRDELEVFYQPIVRAGTRHMVAVEALLRWRHPFEGVLPAASFIDIAVKSGLITHIGHWVIGETCRQLSAWRDEFADRAPGVVFVNLSARELNDPELPKIIAAAVHDYGLTPDKLGIEIVEDDLSTASAVARLYALHRKGHPLSIDDFGTGYSSLSRLLDLPVQIVKMDKTFVERVPGPQRHTRLVAAVLLMATHIDADVVAEGVETAEQEAHLVAAGCQLLQGFRVAAPQAAAELTSLWRNN